VSAAALAIPAVATACGEGAAKGRSCCKSHATSASSDCHQSTAPATSSSAACVSKSCPCCRPAAPQNVPTENTLVQLTGAAAPADAPLFHGGTEFSNRIVGNEPSNLAAIPHRILHCSWLI
jgi:hypothetical protein